MLLDFFWWRNKATGGGVAAGGGGRQASARIEEAPITAQKVIKRVAKKYRCDSEERQLAELERAIAASRLAYRDFYARILRLEIEILQEQEDEDEVLALLMSF